MIQIRRILFPTDFSANANAARAYACHLAQQNGAELHVLNVLFDPGFVMTQPEYLAVPPVSWDDAKKAAEASLETSIEESWQKKLRIVKAVRKGSPFLEIIRYAREAGIDLIVMSTHGRTGLPHLLLGSVAENVVRKAGCPVLTVHPKDHSFVMP